MLPFWISYLMRMLAWVNLLQTDGFINRILGWLHLGSGNRNWLDGDWPTVVFGLVYGYIPFFILPLYAALERLDGRLIEASRDLGASSASTFLRVTLPLSIPGLMAASVIILLPMCGDYYTNTYLTGGSPRTEMVGNQIEFFLRKPRLHAFEQGHEERIAMRCAVMFQRQHEPYRIGAPAAQGPAGLVGGITMRGRRLYHTLPRVGIDVFLAVERTRHGADRKT